MAFLKQCLILLVWIGLINGQSTPLFKANGKVVWQSEGFKFEENTSSTVGGTAGRFTSPIPVSPMVRESTFVILPAKGTQSGDLTSHFDNVHMESIDNKIQGQSSLTDSVINESVDQTQTTNDAAEASIVDKLSQPEGLSSTAGNIEDAATENKTIAEPADKIIEGESINANMKSINPDVIFTTSSTRNSDVETPAHNSTKTTSAELGSIFCH